MGRWEPQNPDPTLKHSFKKYRVKGQLFSRGMGPLAGSLKIHRRHVSVSVLTVFTVGLLVLQSSPLTFGLIKAREEAVGPWRTLVHWGALTTTRKTKLFWVHPEPLLARSLLRSGCPK